MHFSLLLLVTTSAVFYSWGLTETCRFDKVKWCQTFLWKQCVWYAGWIGDWLQSNVRCQARTRFNMKDHCSKWVSLTWRLGISPHVYNILTFIWSIYISNHQIAKLPYWWKFIDYVQFLWKTSGPHIKQRPYELVCVTGFSQHPRGLLTTFVL